MVMIVVSDVVTLKERGKFQGILGGVVATANSLGPVVGGAIVETTTCELREFQVRIVADLSLFASPGRWCFVSKIFRLFWGYTNPSAQYLNLFFVPIAIAVVIFALPLKGVKGDIRTKLKQVDYIGAATILASAILMLTAISW